MTWHNLDTILLIGSLVALVILGFDLWTRDFSLRDQWRLVAIAAGLFILTFLTPGCVKPPSPSITQAAATPIGAAILAKASNNVVDLGLNAGATKIDTGNPYLHSIAVGLRANEGQIIQPSDVQKIVRDYGDPTKPEKMKTLALNLWQLIKSASGRIALSAATELAAQGIQQGAMTK